MQGRRPHFEARALAESGLDIATLPNRCILYVVSYAMELASGAAHRNMR